MADSTLRQLLGRSWLFEPSWRERIDADSTLRQYLDALHVPGFQGLAVPDSVLQRWRFQLDRAFGFEPLELYSRPSRIYYYSAPELTKITTNPAGTKASRFVVASLQLGMAERDGDLLRQAHMEAISRQLAPYAPLMRAIVIDALRGRTVDELQSQMKNLTSDLRRRLGERVIGPHLELPGRHLILREVIFTDFVIQ